MGLVFSAPSVWNALAGVFLLALGVALWRSRARTPASRSFGAFALLLGLRFLPGPLLSPDDPAVPLVQLWNAATSAAAAVALVAFARLDLRALGFSGRTHAVALGAGFTVATTVIVLIDPISGRPVAMGGPRMADFIAFFALLGVEFSLLAAYALRIRFVDERDRRRLGTTSIGVGLFPAFLAGTNFPDAASPLEGLPGVAASVWIAAAWLGQGARQERIARDSRNVALAILGAVLLGMILRDLLGVGRGVALLGVGIVAYQVLREVARKNHDSTQRASAFRRRP